MKKSLILALAAAGMLSACTSNDDLGNENVSELAKQKIELGVSSATVQTRGTGTVGDLEDGENVWAGQELFVYMLDKGEMSLGLYKDPDAVGNATPVFDNEKFSAPTGADQAEATTQSGKIAYYPVSGNYDFWGYRVDDAGVGTPYMVDEAGDQTDVEADAVARVIDVKINGSQDIMTGKAVPTEADVQKLGQKPENFFSAYAARKDVQPNIKFEHNLARLTFHVRAGSKATCGQIANGDVTDPVYVTDVKVLSKNEGKLTVAYKGEKPASVLNFSEATDSLHLMQRSVAGVDNHNLPLEKLDPVALTWNNETDAPDTIKVGEALLVAPGEVSYPLTIDLTQVVKQNVNGDSKKLALQQNTKIEMDPNGVKTFEAGKSYDVTITVYGLERIVVTATLVGWQDGGSIDIDDDRVPDSEYTEPNA